MNTTTIKDLRKVKHLCRICLTGSKNMIDLHSKVEEELELDATVSHILSRVMSAEIITDKNYPSYVCSLCMSLTNLAYKLKLQFENSQTLLQEYFTGCVPKNGSPEAQNRVEETSSAPVELITGNGRYDIKDLIIIEDEKGEEHCFEGFLRNLGSEVSAVFANDTINEMKEVPKDAITLIIKVEEEQTDDSVPRFESTEDSAFDTDSKPTDELFDDKFQCKICLKLFAMKKYLKRHVKDVHCRTGDQNYLCQLCGWLGNTKSGLYHHMVSKHQERKFECEDCGKKYISIGHYNQHRLVHSNARSHLCSICGKAFNYANALEYHMRLHTGEKKYKCSYCDRRFTMACSQKRHMLTHTGIRPYGCKYCDKAFRSRGEVNCHEMLHTGFRPYHCKHCGRGFTKTHNLKIHLLAHIGPHMCEICSKTFIEMDYLKMHMKISHSDEIGNDSE